MYKYSIVVPVYNSKDYIEQAVQSVVTQTYSNYELILVNDGSTDNSSEICHQFEKEYPDKIVVLDCENSGTSSARNTGMSVATGDYIGFLDNDDYWRKSDFLEKLDLQLSKSKADAVIYLSEIFNDQTGEFTPTSIKLKRKDIEEMPFESRVETLLSSGVISSVVWEKFVRREIVFNEPTLFFPDNMRNEDTDFSAKLLMKISSIDYYDDTVYAYRKGTTYSQTSKSLKKEHIIDLMNIIKDNCTAANNLNTVKKNFVFKFLSYPYIVLLGQLSIFDSYDEFIPFIKEYSFLLKHPKFPYIRVIYYFIKALGVKLTVKIIGIPFKLKYPNITHD
ncbi:MAG: glycosyltransferase family 2 protein [Clostridia bacterium]|nr:glycosyltransferase family 2 protein [Clostridia bacterium]